MNNTVTGRKIKVGIVGSRRGSSFAASAKYTGMELVAICDNFKTWLDKACETYQVKGYTDYDEFLTHDMDAVVIATPFHMHAPFAIKALRAGKHVLSETSCNITIAEGVELCRTVEETGLCYMLAENYCYFKCNMEMKRLYDNGEIGNVTYAEGEYNHPGEAYWRLSISPGKNHWRAKIPSTYYNTHALAPLMYITDTMPVSVNALAIKCDEINEGCYHTGEVGSAILCRMDNGAVFRIFGLMLPGHSVYYRLHGSEGAMESPERDVNRVHIWHEDFQLKEGREAHRVYSPEWEDNSDLAESAGHGGGDFWTEYYFAEAIRSGIQPFLDVYRGVAMSSVGILAWKSAFNNGQPFEIPNFRDENSRKKYENDHDCPFHDLKGIKPIPYYTEKERDITKDTKVVENARKAWASVGYTEEEIDELLK